MKTGFPISFCASLLACLVCSSPSTFATPQVQKQSVVSNALSSPLIAQNSRAGATSNSAGAGTQETSRERRAQAYAKLLEGQRYLMSSRRSRSSERSLQSAREAFAQAAQLDPALAEAHTALAELAFFREDLEQAEREATAAIRINRDNFGAHRLLSRIYVLRSGLPEGKIDRTAADRAINELQEVVRLDSNNAEAWALLGELYSATNREREAINAYMRWAAAPVAIDGRIFQAITQGRLEL